MPAYHLRTLYLVKQSVWGTAGLTHQYFRLEGVTEGDVTVNIQDDVLDTIGWNVGNIPIKRLRDSEINVSLTATYEQFPVICHGVFGITSPVSNQDNTLYTWTYKVPRTNTVNTQLYTIRYGIGTDYYQLINCLFSELTLKARADSSLDIETTLISPDAPEPSNIPTVSLVNMSAIHAFESSFYLSNANTNPFDTSAVLATLRSFEITINPNRHIKRFIGNDTYYGDGKWNIEGSLSLEFNNTSEDIIEDVFDNVTVRNLGLRFVSSTNPNKRVSIIMPFIVTDSFDLFSDADGNATVDLKIKAVYNQLFDTAFQVEVQKDTNKLAS